MKFSDKGSENLKLDITEITAQAFVFFLGGFDTSKSQMCLMAHELILNPDIQKRLQDDIDEVLKKSNGKPNYDAIVSMPYLDAFFFEAMRKHPQAFILDRECGKTYELPPSLPGAKPVIVEPGLNLWIPTVGVHNDEKFYDNPDKFDPERYDSQFAKSMISRLKKISIQFLRFNFRYLNKKITFNQVESLGFGIGPRSCIGNRFAILETKILIFHLLAKFNLKPNAKTKTPFVYDTKNLSILPPGGFWVTFERRK